MLRGSWAGGQPEERCGGCQVAEKDCRNRSLWVSLWVRVFASGSIAHTADCRNLSLRVQGTRQVKFAASSMLPFRCNEQPADKGTTGGFARLYRSQSDRED